MDSEGDLLLLKTIWGMAFVLVVFEFRGYRKAIWINTLHKISIV
jgi:hypothetical protein